jgi:aspartyl-tRNA synthetase
MSEYRSAYATDLGAERVGEPVRLSGWVVRPRDHGGVVFFELRDASGLVQIVADPASIPVADDLKMEWCVSVEGTVQARPEGMENPDLATGAIEVAAGSLDVLSRAAVLPFMIDDRTDADERVRLQYRYLDLRRPRMAANLRARSLGIAAIRRTLDESGFLDVETPTLINSTPEGARDFLVPSRLRPGHFYALPQSPQLFKQLLMIGGVDRYYQIARCYRDEDFRSDRQIEFTQLDLEGAFWGQEDVLETIEAVVVAAVKALRGVDIETPLARLTYADAMDRYGTDKPDLRFGMEIHDLSGVFDGTAFRGFAGVLDGGGVVRGLNIGRQEMSRGQLDGLVDRAKELGAAGLVWIAVEADDSFRSPVTKFFSEGEIEGIRSALDATPGDVLCIVADQSAAAGHVLGQLRLDHGRPDTHTDLAFAWVVDFPMFEQTDEGGLVPAHHPFTSPADVDELRSAPAAALSKSYDLVLNGSELGSGSVRIHDPEVQAQIFEILGISDEEASRRFGWFLEALRYGTPPHAGFAIGLDRLFAILQDEDSIREVIPFPKTQTGADPLTTAPTLVDTPQMHELGIELTAAVRAALAEEASRSVASGDEHEGAATDSGHAHHRTEASS